MVHEKESSVGKAYGFFACRASMEEMNREISKIRKRIGHPKSLEMQLTPGKDFAEACLDFDLKSMPWLEEQTERGYVLKGSSLQATPRDIAQELMSIMVHAYISPLYVEGEKFEGSVIHKKGGKYIRIPSQEITNECSDCRKGCNAPFQLTEGKCFYCRECYVKQMRKRF